MFKNFLTKFRNNKVPTNLVTELMGISNRLPVSFVRGQGSELWDIDGNQYLDAFTGGGVASLGHSHPTISEAISLQAAKLLHSGNQFHNVEQANLAALICELCGMEKVVFAQTLAEANSAALALVRAWALKKNLKSPMVLTTNSQLRLSCELSKTIHQDSYGARTPNTTKPTFELIRQNNIDDIGKFSANENVAAIFIESVSSEGSLTLVDVDYLIAVRNLCNEKDWLMIVEESQTGLGRTGEWFRFQHSSISPDIVVAADTLANGLPLALCATKSETGAGLEAGDHETTYGGNQLASQAASALIEELRSQDIVKSVGETGEYFKRQLQHRIGTLNVVRHISGSGLFIRIELDRHCANLATLFLLQGLVVGVNQQQNIIYLLPALNISQDQSLLIARKICSVLESL